MEAERHRGFAEVLIGDGRSLLILTCGVLVLGCIWCAAPSRHLWQALGVAGTAGFACALGVHFAVGYTDFLHLLPAIAGSGLFLLGLVLSRKSTGADGPP